MIWFDALVEGCGAGEDSGAISGEEEVLGGSGVRLGSDDDRTLFQFGNGNVGRRNDGFGGLVDQQEECRERGSRTEPWGTPWERRAVGN